MPHIPDQIMRWLGPAIVCIIGGVVIFGNPISQHLICDGTQNCLVTWIGALSGWAALGGALLTIAVMREQVEEARRQTDHLVGNGDPEIYLSTATEETERGFFPLLFVTVVNRNRRPLDMRRVNFICRDPILDIAVRSIAISDQEQRYPLALQTKNKYIHRILKGREDGRSADSARMVCHVLVDGQLERYANDPESWASYDVVVEVDATLKDATDRRVMLRAEGIIDF